MWTSSEYSIGEESAIGVGVRKCEEVMGLIMGPLPCSSA